MLLAVAVTAGFGLAGAAAVRMYLAERTLQTVARPDLERALRLAPGNSIAWARLGAVLEREGDPEGAARALREAVRLNSYNAPAWVDLGLHYELQGDLKQAEQCLAEAVRVDNGVATHWAAVNFFIRQSVDDRFWAAMRRLLTRSLVHPNLVPAFELCWRASGDPGEILRKAIPDDPEVLRKYFQYLLDTGRKPGLPAVWTRLAALLEARDLDPALRYADVLLEDRLTTAAVQAWNALTRRGLTPHEALEPARGSVVTNGRFRHRPSGRAFDWRTVPADGVSVDIESRGVDVGLWVRLSGAHPESTELFWQWMPVEPNRTYQLRFRYRTDGLPPDTGLYWTARDESGPLRSELLTSATLEARGSWTPSQARLRTGAVARQARLIFAYRRSLGTTRGRGWVILSDVELLPEGAAP